jgi:hypothetical protein
MTRTNKRIKQGNTRKIKKIKNNNNNTTVVPEDEDREICKNLANFIATCLSIRDLSDK